MPFGRDDDLYEQAARELRDGTFSVVLWEQAFAEAGGDAERANASYVRLRAQSILAGLGRMPAVPASPRPWAVALWDPLAAVLWSFAFTPAFGTFLHALNWRELGNERKANVATTWFFLSVIAIALFPLLSTRASIALAIGLLALWYAGSGREQVDYAATTLESSYRRRSWILPISAAIGVTAAYSLYFFAALRFAGLLDRIVS